MKSGIVKIGNWWFLGKNTIGLTLYPFIFLKKSWVDKVSEDRLKKTINHEKIHIYQQLELLIIPFYIWYVLEFVLRLFSLSNFDKAYRNISFEREAYGNEKNEEYLTGRKFWNFRHYL